MLRTKLPLFWGLVMVSMLSILWPFIQTHTKGHAPCTITPKHSRLVQRAKSVLGLTSKKLSSQAQNARMASSAVIGVARSLYPLNNRLHQWVLSSSVSMPEKNCHTTMIHTLQYKVCTTVSKSLQLWLTLSSTCMFEVQKWAFGMEIWSLISHSTELCRLDQFKISCQV